MSLYQRVRPVNFADMIGSEGEIKSFEAAITSPDPPHAFLLSGPSGCGKTTAARIAASLLGADEMSITEINSSNNRGIDTAREIQSQMHYLPASGTSRVYIIDEVHMATRDWQNAMLKPLEDIPKHVYFFLCTTDPQKLIPAVKTRLTPVKLSSVNKKDLFRFIRKVNKDEGSNVSNDVLKELALVAEGSPRTALVLLEKISGMDEEAAYKILEKGGEEENQEVIDLCRALLSKKAVWGDVSAILKGLSDTDPEKIRRAVLGYANSVLLKSSNERAAAIIEAFSEPFYDTGKAGVTLACFDSING